MLWRGGRRGCHWVGLYFLFLRRSGGGLCGVDGGGLSKGATLRGPSMIAKNGNRCDVRILFFQSPGRVSIRPLFVKNNFGGFSGCGLGRAWSEAVGVSS